MSLFHYEPVLKNLVEGRSDCYEIYGPSRIKVRARTAVLADPPVMGYAISQNPDWKLEFTAFADKNPDFPMLAGKGRQFVLA